jgi:DNA-binding transcriptional ArsR family regulator
LLLGRRIGRSGLVERFAGCFTDSRAAEPIEHEVVTLVGQRVFGIALGYEDLVDHDELRHDLTLAVLELAHVGGVSPQTASGHLSKLTEGGLLLVHKQGRHSGFRLASLLTRQMLEGSWRLPWRDLRRSIGRAGAATRRCLSPVPATTILPGGSAWR